jgi:hypothetical protein
MDTRVVKQMVRQFCEKTAHTGGEAHCFAPWYLQQKFKLSETQAMQQSSDGNYDFGIDAFHLVKENDGTASSLLLVQAKYSESIQYIVKGVRDLEKALPEVASSLRGIGTEEPIQNNVLANLRAALNRLGPEIRARLIVDFEVLHLSAVDEIVLLNRLQEATNRLDEALRDKLDDYTCHIRQVGPRELGPQQVVVAPPEEVTLRINGAHEFNAGESRMFSGIGRLADLVDLYNARRDDLFSRNVRYYLSSKKNTEKGPAGKMRATLKQMCVESKLEPAHFALFHNGITMFSRKAELTEGEIRIRDPYVLNGCQTIKNAFFFRFDPNLKSKINHDCWQQVFVPIRIIETSDDDLVRAVTVNTNRQNAISSAALRANDPVQIRLEQRFKERGLFYERQEGALESVVMARPDLLEDVYENTPRGASVDIHDIARAIAAAGGEISTALRPNDLFENDAAYARCFNENTRLRSIVFLTFLQNLHDTVGVVLKKDLNLEPKEGGPKPSRFTYHTICLLARYLAKEHMHDFVMEWGTKLHLSDKGFREEVRRVLSSHKSGIRGEIAKRLMTLVSADANEVNAAFEKCKNVLYLKDGIRPFEVFADIDEKA